MTSITTYTEIIPTYLYIKQHSITKKMYFGKTTKPDPIKYKGSGVYWKRHINKHGRQFVKTIWLSDLYFDTSIVEHALHFSHENNIVESDTWANQKPENGLDGGSSKGSMSDHTKSRLLEANIGRPLSDEHKAKISAAGKGRKGDPFSDEHKAKLSAAAKIRIVSDETKAKMSATRKGVPKSDETKAKMSAANKAYRLKILDKI